MIEPRNELIYRVTVQHFDGTHVAATLVLASSIHEAWAAVRHTYADIINRNGYVCQAAITPYSAAAHTRVAPCRWRVPAGRRVVPDDAPDFGRPLP